MISRQLEMRFQNQPGHRPAGRSRGRPNGANGWFGRMRDVVDQARDWPPAPPPVEAPRPPARWASAGPPLAEANPRASGSVPLATGANALSTSEPHRWRFSRARRLIWE
jgi:hypothetical protein